ncbi:MAG: hypothetical protein LBK18_10150 [Prevotellaceae bacterium]|jgi:hypothetical protein|nr:hypothetical protein [Prevotellaceae bacterium]
MDTRTKIEKIFDEGAKKFAKMQAGIHEDVNSDDVEQDFMAALQAFSHALYQEMVGGGKRLQK